MVHLGQGANGQTHVEHQRHQYQYSRPTSEEFPNGPFSHNIRTEEGNLTRQLDSQKVDLVLGLLSTTSGHIKIYQSKTKLSIHELCEAMESNTATIFGEAMATMAS